MSAEANKGRRQLFVRQVFVAIFGVVFLFALVGIAVPVTERYRVAWDKGEVACLPYRIFLIDLHDQDVVRGELVSFKTHGLSAKHRPNAIFTKLVAGVPGDKVDIRDGEVFVGGRLYGPLFLDVAKVLGQPAASFERSFTLADEEFFVVGTEHNSFDSRFYGPVSQSTFVGQTRGVW